MSMSTTRTAFGRIGSSSRRALLRSASSKAASSSAAQPPRFSLSEEKLRHLVSLYHQSRAFVTRETLEKKIDEAFINNPAMANSTTGQYRSYSELMTDVRKRREQPAVRPLGRPNSSAMSTIGQPNPARAEAVFEAMYGTSNGRNVGLELVLESWGSTAQRLKEIKKEKARSDTAQARSARAAK